MSDPEPVDIQTCEEAFARVYEYLDKVLTPEEEAAILEHLAICEACTHHFDWEERLLDRIREKSRTSRAPEELRRKIDGLLDRL
jgi:anti-sigma factor (TIGR02949 family)